MGEGSLLCFFPVLLASIGTLLALRPLALLLLLVVGLLSLRELLWGKAAEVAVLLINLLEEKSESREAGCEMRRVLELYSLPGPADQLDTVLQDDDSFVIDVVHHDCVIASDSDYKCRLLSIHRTRLLA